MDNAIEQFMKQEDNVRIIIGGRWLYWDKDNNYWVVAGRTYKQKVTRYHYTGLDIAEALHELRKGDYGV